MKTHYETLPSSTIDLIKVECLSSLADPSSLIRATVGILITTIHGRGSIQNWPELVPTLCNLLDSGDFNAVEVIIIRMMPLFGLDTVNS